jgi:hypothetical protein
MVANITYTKTTRGEQALIKELPEAVGQVLTIMNGDLTEEELLAKLQHLSDSAFRDAMTWLLEGGFIKLTDTEPFSFTQPDAAALSAIQVQEISIDEFDATTNAIETDKEKTRLKAIERAKQISAAKAKEIAKLNAETEVKKKTEVIAKKEEWARIKTEAENKAEAQEKQRSEAEEKMKAAKWVQLKAEAKEKAEVEAKQQAIIKAAEQIKRQRLANKARSKNLIKQWLVKLFNGIKVLFFAVFFGLCLLVIVAHFVNIPVVANQLEKIGSERIQNNINIQSAHVWLFPRPHLLLKNISITDATHIQTNIHAKKVRIYPNVTNLKEKIIGLFTTPNKDPYKIQLVQIESLGIAQKDLSHLLTWGKLLSDSQEYSLHQLAFEDLSLQITGLTLPPLYIDVFLNSTNTLRLATIHTIEKDFNLIINGINGDYLMDVDANNWRAPFSPFPAFTQLNATGVIKNDELTFSSIAAQLYGGNLTAKLSTNLISPKLVSTGSFKLDGLMMNKLANGLKFDPAVTGTLTSRGDFSVDIDQTSNKIHLYRLDATFNVQNGVIKKIDIVEAMRTKNINGSTNFSKLTGNVSMRNQNYQFNQLFLQDNQLQAHGQVDISANQQVSASISSSIALQDNPIDADLIIEGPITALKLIH